MMRWTFAPGQVGRVHWDIVAQVGQIEENSDDRGDHERVKIFHLFDSAEFNDRQAW